MKYFKFEYKMMCIELTRVLLDNYASQVQFVEYELDNILADSTGVAKQQEPRHHHPPHAQLSSTPTNKRKRGVEKVEVR